MKAGNPPGRFLNARGDWVGRVVRSLPSLSFSDLGFWDGTLRSTAETFLSWAQFSLESIVLCGEPVSAGSFWVVNRRRGVGSR